MPKIIENLSQRLLAEARRQVAQVGYAAMNIRDVAKNCGVGVGTVYNYFPSKDALIAGFLVEDWKESLARIEAIAGEAATAEPVLAAVYRELNGFRQNNSDLFRSASQTMPAPPRQYHAILRGQISGLLRRFCADAFAADFAAEAMLTWSVQDIPEGRLIEMVMAAAF